MAVTEEISKVTRNKTPQLKLLLLKTYTKTGELKEDPLDLRMVFIEFNIYMSLYESSTSGDLFISESIPADYEDKRNLITKWKMAGLETIEIAFNSNSSENTTSDYEDFHRLFFVHAIDSVLYGGETTAYCLRFTDVFSVLNTDMRFSCKYEGKIEDILKTVINVVNNHSQNEIYKKVISSDVAISKELDTPYEYDSYYIVENNLKDSSCPKSAHNFSLTVPLWKPLVLIDYLVSSFVSQESHGLGYKNRFTDGFFYQDRKGRYNLKTYKQMFTDILQDKNKKDVVFDYSVQKLKSKNYNPEESKYNIEAFAIKDCYSTQLNKLSGFFGFTSFLPNFVTAQKLEDSASGVSLTKNNIFGIIKEYNIYEKFPEDKKLYIYDKSFVETTNPVILMMNVCGINTTLKAMEYENITLAKQVGSVIRQYLERYEITLSMNGISDLDIGKTVTIDMHTPDKESGNLYFTQNIPWVISNISHKFTADLQFSTVVKCFTPILNIEEYSIQEETSSQKTSTATGTTATSSGETSQEAETKTCKATAQQTTYSSQLNKYYGDDDAINKMVSETSKASSDELNQYIKEASATYGIDEKYIRAIIATESGGNQFATNSSSSAVGYMQLLAKYHSGEGTVNLFDAQTNINTGVAYLQYQYNRYGGDMEKAIIAYNQGSYSENASRTYYNKVMSNINTVFA